MDRALSMKTAIGIDIFKHGGFHAYMQCLSSSFPLRDAGGRSPGVLVREKQELERRTERPLSGQVMLPPHPLFP